MRPRNFLLTLVLLVSAPVVGVCDNFRCPSSQIVETGMNQYEVQVRCGEPASKANLTAPNSNVVKEEWTYDFGPYQFIRKLTFVNGALANIVNTGNYGVKIPPAAVKKSK